MQELTIDAALEICKQIFPEAVSVRISRPVSHYFLVVGQNRNTKEDGLTWVNERGEDVSRDYVAEMAVASGETLEAMIADARRYKEISLMTWQDYFEKQFGIKVEKA